jgi:hypothetical protein
MNIQYDYDFGPNGRLAPLQERSAHPDFPGMIAPPIGWIELCLALDEELATLIPDYTIAQVKEKFGGLRFYIGTYGIPHDDPRYAMARTFIANYENASTMVCQVCGNPGENRANTLGWAATLCDDHVS